MEIETASESDSISLFSTDKANGGVTIADARAFPYTKTLCSRLFPKINYWQEDDPPSSLLPNEHIAAIYGQLAPLYRQIFLQKLNLDQVLALVEGNLREITVDKRKGFNSYVIHNAIKLKQILHMSTKSLIKNLDKQEVQMWFIAEPLLFKNVVKYLAPHHFEHQQVKNVLIQCLNIIRMKNNPLVFTNFSVDDAGGREFLCHEIAQIRNGQTEVCHNRYIKEDGHAEEDVELILKNRSLKLNKHRLALISKYFADLFKSSQLSLVNIEANDGELALLINLIDGEIPTVKEANFMSILSFANRFGITIYKDNCDNFLANFQKASELAQFFVDNVGFHSQESYWQFCCINDLKKAQQKLCIYFAQCLNHLKKNDDNILETIKTLDDFHRKETLIYFDRANFMKKLKNPSFLYWISKKSASLHLNFLTDLIKHFIDDSSHSLEVSHTWFVTPNFPPTDSLH